MTIKPTFGKLICNHPKTFQSKKTKVGNLYFEAYRATMPKQPFLK